MNANKLASSKLKKTIVFFDLLFLMFLYNLLKKMDYTRILKSMIFLRIVYFSFKGI